METRKLNEIIWREDLYPRIHPDPTTIQRYAENLDVLPPIEVNQHNELIDGYHRWTAHRKAGKDEIPVTVTKTKDEAELLKLAITRNATHGMQLSSEDKRSMARKIFSTNGHDKKALAALLSVTERTVSNWVSDIEKAKKEERDRKIFEMWMACYTSDEIAKTVDTSRQSVDLLISENFPKLANLRASYQEEDWSPELYDVWNFAKKTNEVKHYGNTEVRIVDNLLYTFTEPFDIVIDPFAGGGSTIDICKKRMRRYWASDREPVIERPDIRKHDLVKGGISGPYHWQDASLVYLDPPYWKQAAGKYSNSPNDLANMSLEKFTKTLIDIIEGYGKKMKTGTHIACITSPTQWPNEDKHVNYHDIDLACGVKLNLVRRAVCPYSSEQYNGTQVNIAKEKKLWMVLSRTLLVWEVTK